MSEINLNNNDSQIDGANLNIHPNNMNNMINPYYSLRLNHKPKKNKKISFLSKLKILSEISLIIIAFVLSLKKAIKVVMKNHHQDIDVVSNKNNIAIKDNLNNNIKIKKDIKVCLCTIGRKENRYIKEFVNFYEKMGVDKIVLYDTNDEQGEKFEEVINDYIKKGFVEVLNYRGKKSESLKMMNHCYQNNYINYDWMIFFDIDEFIHLNKYTDIKTFLNEKKFDKCQKIYLNWVFHTDNNSFHYEKLGLQERFTKKEKTPEKITSDSFNYVKSIIKGNITNLNINNKYTLSNDIQGCNGYGKKPTFIGLNMKESDFENYYIDHFFYKSIDEFIEKLKSNDYDKTFKNLAIKKYFEINELAYEKIIYIENKTGLNLSFYRNKLKRTNKHNKKNKIQPK